MQNESSTSSLSNSTATPNTGRRKTLVFTKFFKKLARTKPTTSKKQSTTITTVDKPQPVTAIDYAEMDDDKLPAPIPPVIPPEVRAQAFPIQRVIENKWVIE